MNIEIKQISSLEKVKLKENPEFIEKNSRKAVAGERINYQITIKSDTYSHTEVTLESPFGDAVRVYSVKEVVCDTAYTSPDAENDGYLLNGPGMIPDVLVPMEEQNWRITLKEKRTHSLFVSVDVPEDAKAGKYEIKVKLAAATILVGAQPDTFVEAVYTIDVIPAVMPEQTLIYTRWFYADCIAVYHNLEIYSEKHWEYIEKYINEAVRTGQNMILVPVHTPPLDTEIGTARPCVQLVDIEKTENGYKFGFEKLERFIALAERCGMKYYEIAHMFSQWGAKCAPNIEVTVNGKKELYFGWHVASDSEEYLEFLPQYLTALCEEFDKLGITDRVYFHISDEPSVKQIEKYENAMKRVKPYIGSCKTFDAVSHFEFYELGLIECPVTLISSLAPFLKENIENQWTYYCCGPQGVYPNSFLAMPLYRVRVLGFQLYKYNIKGFLHWGLNYYNSERSRYPINPYVTTSADGVFPSGDGYILYPSKSGAYGSLRGEAMKEALDDMRICQLLEKKIGREKVIEMIDSAAGGELKFNSYPRNNEYLESLRAAMIEKIEN